MKANVLKVSVPMYSPDVSEENDTDKMNRDIKSAISSQKDICGPIALFYVH